MPTEYWVQYIDNEVTYRIPATNKRVEGEACHTLTARDRVVALRNMGFEAWLVEQ